ncbi:hypothetical protein KUCAC02_025742 [Chaenocephalus aceratus]|uniref:Uncharacterized protein n=1 Tax=Chaenocephalus aceratus TaxID=36190 RepID=A0ACB9VVR1_CHAAC|nr:hypothetical protein KUCAC02_025742 [Chaenocephalus aceratus]
MPQILSGILCDTERCKQYKGLSILFEIYLVLAVNTTVCERGFSCMKRVKNDWRSCLGTEQLSRLMFPSIEDPSMDNFDAAGAVEKWWTSGNRARRPGFNPWQKEQEQEIRDDLYEDLSNLLTSMATSAVRGIILGENDSAKVTLPLGIPSSVEELQRQTKQSLEEERLALLSEAHWNNNQQVVKDKMERTFAYRRHEVIEDKPFIAEFKRRWPALFSEREVEAEFARITTVPLRSKFMQQLDHHSSKLLRIFQKKGGAAGQKIRNIMAEYDKNDAIETRRASVIKALIVYLNEDPKA